MTENAMTDVQFNNNIEYWDARYKKVGAARTVGCANWTPEQYKKANDIWYDWCLPLIELVCINRHNIEVGNKPKVLDFGCGSGRWFQLLSKYFEYYGTDIVTLENMGINSTAFTFQPVVDNKIPSFSIDKKDIEVKFDLIWTCVALQHIIDDNLLEYTVFQFSERLQPDGKAIILENTANAKSSNYLKFRGIAEYISIFSKYGLICTAIDTKKMKGEPHTLFTFVKA